MSNLGAGYQSMTPNRASRIAISKDATFRTQFIVNNKACSRHEACKKNPPVND